ncbi:MAG: MgtC/SapB family protein [Rhizobiaceae bacterium]|nr:MgtC/SapB family protein [Rhizobiaceae bacterium]
MNFVETFQLSAIFDSALSLVVAFLCGTVLGAERQYRQRSAGLRTNTLVAIGAAAFVDLGQRVGGDVETVRVISYVVSGIGFLGAGVIMKDGANIRGLNTAATLWCSAAAGACAGSDRLAEAILVTLTVLAANTLLHPLVDRINRAPINAQIGEATFVIRATTDLQSLSRVRRQAIALLNAAHYPARDIEVIERGDDVMEIEVTLVSTAIVVHEIESVVAKLAASEGVVDASWESSSGD